MSKPIKLTDKFLEQVVEEFKNSIAKTKMFDGKINYTKQFQWKDAAKARVDFEPIAFAKMVSLVFGFSSEVAWHGVVIRDESDPTLFHVKDILVYPQQVTGATVETDQEAYQSCMYAHNDDIFNNLRLQGHSHVEMSTSPSGVDLTHQEKILDQLDDDMFYIFVIWNRKMERNIRIFDRKYNTLYEKEDVEVGIGGVFDDLDKFVSDAKAIVKPKTYASTSTATAAKQSASTTAKQNTSTTTSPPKSKPKLPVKPYNRFDDEDYGGYGWPSGYSGYGGWNGSYR